MFTQQELNDYIRDLSEDGMLPTYETAEYDMIVNIWTDHFDPSDVLKESGHYDKLKELIRKTTISGILYRGIDVFINDNVIDYSTELTNWYKDYKSALDETDPDNSIILKCEFDNMKGMKIINREDNQVIIDEMKLKIIDKDCYVFNVEVIQ